MRKFSAGASLHKLTTANTSHREAAETAAIKDRKKEIHKSWFQSSAGRIRGITYHVWHDMHLFQLSNVLI